jgi:hypothetical protein
MEMSQTHCYATVTVTLLWKRHKLIAMQQQLSRYYGNAIKDLICHSITTQSRQNSALSQQCSDIMKAESWHYISLQFLHLSPHCKMEE